MPSTPTPTDPEQTASDTAPESGNSFARDNASDPNTPVSFVPHQESGAVENKPVVIQAGRYGALEHHELIRLLDTIEDERARGRFRESIYISFLIWLAIAWLVLYGPRYLWHAPKLVLPSEVLRQRELTQLSMPRLTAPAPRPAPKLDNHTLNQLREDTAHRAVAPPPPHPAAQPKVEAAPPAPSPITPTPSNAAPNIPLPSAPKPTVARTPAPPVADAPTPQPSSRANLNTGSTSASDAIQNAIRNSARNHGEEGGPAAPSGGGLGTGVDILSDTQGVNFDPYIRRILHDIYYTWLPLIPEEARPPLNKSGVTQIRFTILPDGHIGGMHLDGSTHDDALNRAAWGSITGVGQFPPLPSQFHGPNLELRIHYLVNKHEE